VRTRGSTAAQQAAAPLADRAAVKRKATALMKEAMAAATALEAMD